MIAPPIARSVQTSVIIPAYNKWELTEACLRSLEQSLGGKNCEIIVVDNASSDATRECCQALGNQLFGDFFQYHRAERNLNFGPASNLGARMGRGEYLLFLNNDTLAVPDCPDWYTPLLEDFSTWPNIAATGPVLLYPPSASAPSFFGSTVQHLGVFVSPTFKVGHLYEGIPAASPLAAKRRFFQIITAACMLMPRALFLEHGGFNEGFVNGFEDVDLCARLWAGGRRMTVNPTARLYHLTSQTPGRHTHEESNSRLFADTSLRLLTPDWHLHLAADDVELQVTVWQSMSPGMNAGQRAKLAPLLATDDPEAISNALTRFPLWHEGYAALADCLKKREDPAGEHAFRLSLTQLRPVPENLIALLQSAGCMRDEQALSFAFSTLCKYCLTFEQYVNGARDLLAWARDIGLEGLAGQFQHWLDTSEIFREQLFLPFLQTMRDMTKGANVSPLDNWAYTLWRELEDLPARAKMRVSQPDPPSSIAFSVLMPVYNPEPKHLLAAVDSLLQQEWPHWELCMADDASPDPRIRPLLQELTARDPRIRVEFRETNGHIAEATNTALAMARHAHIALMDQDDLLTPDALREMALAIQAHPDGLLFYSDEDKVLDDGTIFYPYFKNTSWDWDLLLGQNMVNHLGVYRTDRLRAIGGFRSGFPGSQDHDMLLRYAEDLESKQLIHIPKVLYHWRAHAGSTAATISVKSDALDSTRRALTQHLERKNIEGSAELVPGTQCFRIRYALPKPAPLVSLIVDLGTDCPLGPPLAQALKEKAGLSKLELLFLYDQETPPEFKSKLERWSEGGKQARLLPLPQTLPFGARFNAAVKAVRGSQIGILDKRLIPLTQDWLVEVVSRLAQPGVGVVGGKLVNPDKSVHHLGHVADADGRLFSLFRGLSNNEVGYFTWASVVRTVTSTDPRCFFTHKRLLEEANGFEPTMDSAAAIDYCLRLKDKGARVVSTPFAEFLLTYPPHLKRSPFGDILWENGIFVDSPSLYQRWRGRIAPCNPNLEAGLHGMALHWRDDFESAPHAEKPASSSASRNKPQTPVRAKTAPGKNAFTILFIAHECSLTGAPISLLRLLRQLRSSTDYDIGVLALLDGPLLKDFEELCPVETVLHREGFRLSSILPTLEQVEKSLGRLMRRMGRKPDCIFGNTTSSPLAYPCIADLHAPVVTRVAELPNMLRFHISPQTVKNMLTHSNRFVAVSSPVAAMLQGLGAPAESIRIISGGITDYPTTLDESRRTQLLSSLKAKPGAPVLWGCGTPSSRKGIDLFCDVVFRLQDAGISNFQAIWVGEANEESFACLAEIQKAHPVRHQSVAYPGRVMKPYLLMKPGDLFLLTSREDPFPLVALEAAERGLPIIAFKDSGGMVDVVARGAGVLVEYEDSRRMAEVVAALLRSPDEIKNTGERARSIVLENYTLERLGKQFIELFEEMRKERQ